VPGQLSTSSGTPSPSESPPAGRGGAVDDVVVEDVDVVVGRVVVVDVAVGRVVVVVVGRVVVVVDVVVVVVVEIGTVSRHDAPETLCAIRALTALPKRRSMFESPPLRRWQ